MSKAPAIAIVDLNELAQQSLTIGFEIPPNTQVKVIGIAEAEDVVFHIRSACLGAKAKEGERALLAFGENKSICASLSLGKTENVSLDLEFFGDFALHNVNAANTSIHVCGRLVESGDDVDDDDDQDGHGHSHGPDGSCDSEDDDDDSEADEDGFFFGGMGEEDEDDDDDDDDDEDDDEAQANSRVSIEQLPSEDEEEEKQKEKDREAAAAAAAAPPAAKKAKMTPKENLKFAVPAAVKKAEAKQAALTAPTRENVVAFVLEEIKTAGGKAKASDVGASVAKKFGVAYKKMGFEEKTLGKLLQAEAASKVKVEGEMISLK